MSDVEAGRANISIMKLAQIARALGVSLTDLLTQGKDPPQVVALVGLRGAGKSTVGPLLARQLGLAFVELDLLVEEAAGLSLTEIFALHGETYYRALEHDALRTFLDETEGAVIATGGGIVTSSRSWSLLQRRTRVVWLKARAEDHWERVIQQGDARPMADNPQAMEELRTLLRSRSPLYSRAHLAIDTSSQSAERAATELVEALR